jgi:2-keto-myo-inositol isomerase
MQLCISQVSTLTTPLELELQAYARGGWTFMEIWLPKLESYLEFHSLEDYRSLLKTNEIVPIAAASQGGLLIARDQQKASIQSQFEQRLSVLGELEVNVLTLTPDFHQPPKDDDARRAIENLAEAAHTAGRFGVKLALEFQKTSRFIASLDTAAAVVAEIQSESLGICLDFFHFYCGPSKSEDLGFLTRNNLTCVHVSDLMGVPRELAADSDRILPGDGSMPIDAMVRALGEVGYDGPTSLELMNPELWAVSAERVADFGRQALERMVSGARSREPREAVGRGGD